MSWEDLLALPVDWDPEGAPTPSPLAIQIGKGFEGALPGDFRATERDPDVLGGVVLWLEFFANPKPWIWIAVRNSGISLLAYRSRAGSTVVRPIPKGIEMNYLLEEVRKEWS
jgi:hypothetical protein